MKALKKIMVIILCVALLAGISVSALASGTAVSKDESVYTILNADGSIKEETVSCWLHSDGGLSGVSDKSDLTNITNIKSSVEPQNNGGVVTWDTADTDVYYTGNSDKQPPVSVSITYALNGQAISAQDLAGKSGEVSMTYKFTNNEKQTKLIDGANRTVYTPFAVALVMNMPVKSFTEVKAGSSNILTDSNNQVVSYICLPGMMESFDGLLSDDVLSGLKDALSGTFTVTAKTDSFEMPAVVIAAATKLADLKNININDKLTDVTSGIGKLSSAISQLKDGTAQLSSALSEYDSKIGTLGSGYSKFSDSLLQAVTGADALKSGTAQLASAAELLKQEVTAQLIPGITASKSQQQALVDKMTALQKQLSNLKIPDMSTIKTQLTTAVTTVCDASSNATIQILTGKTYNDLTSAQQTAITAAKEKIVNQAGAQITQMLSGIDMSSLQALNTSLTDIETLSTKLMSSMNTLTNALYNPSDDPSNPKTLANAIIALSAGADQLSVGASKLDSGLAQLSGGSKTIDAGLKALIGGSDKLAEKSGELNTGMGTFKSSIFDMLNSGSMDKLGTALEVKDEMVKQADEYTSFTGAPDGAKTTIKFVMKTADLESSNKKDTTQSTAQVKQDSSKLTFWQRIVNFFKSIF
jgi:putative membrane protein